MMRQIFFISFFVINAEYAQGQNAGSIVWKMYNQFGRLKTYTSDVNFVFDIPNVNIKNISGREYFKMPDKHRFKTDGVAFIPVQSTTRIYGFLKDSSKFTALYNATVMFEGQSCYLVHVIPNEEGELILAKIWIGRNNYCPYKIELTTKMGNIRIENQFGAFSKYGLPDQMVFYLDNFKQPKSHMPIKTGSRKTGIDENKTGTITMRFQNYKINQDIPDSVFKVSPKLKNSKENNESKR